jgi:hypothetical protein
VLVDYVGSRERRLAVRLMLSEAMDLRVRFPLYFFGLWFSTPPAGLLHGVWISSVAALGPSARRTDASSLRRRSVRDPRSKTPP